MCESKSQLLKLLIPHRNDPTLKRERANFNHNKLLFSFSTLFSQAIDPTDVAVLAFGSSLTLVFEGGPLPWVLDTSTFFDKG